MDTIQEITRQVLTTYAVKGANFDAYLTSDASGNMLTVVDVANKQADDRFVITSLIVRLEHEFVIIEHDDNDKPLVDALIQAGIPRAQIILAYAGETVPEATI